MIKILIFAVLILTAFPTHAQNNIISGVYETLEKDYINQIDKSQITLRGLKVLSQIDPKIKISLSSKKVYLYYKGKVIEIFILPEPEDDILKWADFSRKIIDKAISVSPDVELYDFEIPDRFAKSVFEGLDGYSHYYSRFDEPQSKITRRNYAERMIDDILLIKILNFNKGVSQKVEKAVINCSLCRGFILDLRGNHGGILDEALKITDLFLDEGIITYTTEKDGQNPRYFTAQAGDISSHKPLVILIDGFSASASEVLAAALSEQNRAVLIGTKSFGKGTIQDVRKLGENSSMALTSAYFFTPSGTKIDKQGINPAICTGKIKSVENLVNADCDPSDRIYEEVDIDTAVKFIKNEL